MRKKIYIISLLIFSILLYSIASIHRFLIRIDRNESDKLSNGYSVIDFNKLIYDDASKFLDVNNHNALTARYLEEISKLKYKVKYLENKINRCEFAQSTNVKSNFTKSPTENITIEHEGDIYSYSAFTYDKFYTSSDDIYKRNIIKLTGARKHHLRRVINDAIEFLNTKQETYKYHIKDFTLGFTRSTPSNGYEYELYFKMQEQCCVRLKFNRRLGALDLVEASFMDQTSTSNDKDAVDFELADDDLTDTTTTKKRRVNFILPVTAQTKQLNSFKLFLSSFESIVINQDSRQASLTIVYSFDENTPNVDLKFENLIKEFKLRTKFDLVKFLKIKHEGSFSRAKSLQYGVENCCSFDREDDASNDHLVFLCDVDVLFNENFLNLCRFNAVKNKRVFYPVLYSFYNPALINKNEHDSALKRENSAEQDEEEETKRINLIINKENGYWRETGFGMVCVYKQDFMAMGGFDEFLSVKTWGGEDLYLYRKFAKSNLEIFRSVTPGLFHLYHAKECNKNLLTKTQYQNCLSVKVFNEASHKKLGLIYFNATFD